MSKYYDYAIDTLHERVHVIYGSRQSGKTYHETTKLITHLTSDELKCIENTKHIVTNLKDEDIKILVKMLLGNRYNKYIERIKENDNN